MIGLPINFFVLLGFLESVSFMMRHPQFLYHVLLLSSCGAGGQLFIFHTISAFGPVTFTIIMTIRQGKEFLSATEFTIPWRTIIRHGGCRLCVCVSVCPGANFARG